MKHDQIVKEVTIKPTWLAIFSLSYCVYLILTCWFCTSCAFSAFEDFKFEFYYLRRLSELLTDYNSLQILSYSSLLLSLSSSISSFMVSRSHCKSELYKKKKDYWVSKNLNQHVPRSASIWCPLREQWSALRPDPRESPVTASTTSSTTTFYYVNLATIEILNLLFLNFI